MRDDQSTVIGPADGRRQPDDASRTQRSSAEGESAAPRWAAGDEGAGSGWTQGGSVPFWAPTQPKREAPPEEVGETVVMELEPETPIPLAWLAVLKGPGAKRGKLVQLQGETFVGRTQGDLILKGDSAVSSQHARVRYEPTGGAGAAPAYVLYDLASTNGTYAGRPDSYMEERNRVYRHVLCDGDFLLLGETTLVFKQVTD